MLTYRTEERAIMDKIPRYNGRRIDRYLRSEETQAVTMPKIYYEFFNHFVKGKECSDSVRSYIVESVKRDKEKMDYRKGLIALYDDQYVVVFLNVEGLDTSAIKITHNEKEKELFRAFISGCSINALSALYAVSLHLLKDKQMARLIKGYDTRGIIYSTYPEKDVRISGFIHYMNNSTASKIANKEVLNSISEALDRNVSIEEIEDILPRDVEARFFNRDFDEYEIAQIDALEPGIMAKA